MKMFAKRDVLAAATPGYKLNKIDLSKSENPKLSDLIDLLKSKVPWENKSVNSGKKVCECLWQLSRNSKREVVCNIFLLVVLLVYLPCNKWFMIKKDAIYKLS